jgi:CheY-like chemotaxis protein
LKVIPKHQPDIVLMDIQLPKLSGIECTAQLNHFRSFLHYLKLGTPFVALPLPDKKYRSIVPDSVSRI